MVISYLCYWIHTKHSSLSFAGFQSTRELQQYGCSKVTNNYCNSISSSRNSRNNSSEDNDCEFHIGGSIFNINADIKTEYGQDFDECSCMLSLVRDSNFRV